MSLSIFGLSRTYLAITGLIMITVIAVDQNNARLSDKAIKECPKIGGRLAEVNGLLTQQYICLPKKKN